MNSEKGIKDLLRQLEKAAELKQDYEAFRLAQEILEIDPANQTAWQKKADALLNLNRPEEALYAYRKAAGIDPPEAVGPPPRFSSGRPDDFPSGGFREDPDFGGLYYAVYAFYMEGEGFGFHTDRPGGMPDFVDPRSLFDRDLPIRVDFTYMTDGLTILDQKTVYFSWPEFLKFYRDPHNLIDLPGHRVGV